MHLPRTSTVVLLASQSHAYTSGSTRDAYRFHRINQLCSFEGRWNSL
jgi:hypothetical protein